MNTADAARALETLHNELVRGTPPTGGYMLNRHDGGLLASLERLSAAQASEIISGGSSIAAHVDHVLYYTRLMNRWAAGEKNPWKGADWKESWTRPTVTQESWAALRLDVERALRAWSEAIRQPREVTETEFAGMVASVAHLAYHLGAIRQMDRRIGGPAANNEVDAFAPSGGLGATG
jgi:hypothetical protein